VIQIDKIHKIIEEEYIVDPALYKLIDAGDGDDLIEAIIKLRRGMGPPPGVERLVSHFGDIHTCRIRRDRILETREHESVESLKAPRLLQLEREVPVDSSLEETTVYPTDHRRPEDIPDGSGVIVGIVDMGLDFAHDNFRNSDGTTRLLALWDQTQGSSGQDNKYGYGRVYAPTEINQALQTSNPYQSLGYHPSNGLPSRIAGSHGTHVTDICAGNGGVPESPTGIAPAADLIFVHLGNRFTGGLANLGDSVRILEALDFIAETAGSKNFVINISIGKHASSHDGQSLVEQALDKFLLQAPGRACVQSGGNYYQSRVHSAVQLTPGRKKTISWFKDPEDTSINEMEIWPSLHDVILVEVRPPGNHETISVPLGKIKDIVIDKQNVGKIFHRVKDPTNNKNVIFLYIKPEAPGGVWKVDLIPKEITDGRAHLWVERDDKFQSRLSKKDAVSTTTLGSIATARLPIVVGAINGHASDFPLAPFSSSGPTVDGRLKPDIVASGVSVLAARSASLEFPSHSPMLTRKSGSSMASPQVCGAIACMFQAAGRPLWIHETRNILLGNTQRLDVSKKDQLRVGNGLLDIEAAIQATEDYVRKETERPEDSFPQNTKVEPILSLQGEEDTVEPYYSGGQNYSWFPSDHLENMKENGYSEPGKILDQLESAQTSYGGIYDSITQGENLYQIYKGFEVIAGPEERVDPYDIRVGDIMIREALGEFIPEYVSIIETDLIPQEEICKRGWLLENNNSGFYARVRKEMPGPNTEVISRRVLDSEGYVPEDTLILRSHLRVDDALDEINNYEGNFIDKNEAELSESYPGQKIIHTKIKEIQKETFAVQRDQGALRSWVRKEVKDMQILEALNGLLESMLNYPKPGEVTPDPWTRNKIRKVVPQSGGGFTVKDFRIYGPEIMAMEALRDKLEEFKDEAYNAMVLNNPRDFARVRRLEKSSRYLFNLTIGEKTSEHFDNLFKNWDLETDKFKREAVEVLIEAYRVLLTTRWGNAVMADQVNPLLEISSKETRRNIQKSDYQNNILTKLAFYSEATPKFVGNLQDLSSLALGILHISGPQLMISVVEDPDKARNLAVKLFFSAGKLTGLKIGKDLEKAVFSEDLNAVRDPKLWPERFIKSQLYPITIAIYNMITLINAIKKDDSNTIRKWIDISKSLIGTGKTALNALSKFAAVQKFIKPGIARWAGPIGSVLGIISGGLTIRDEMKTGDWRGAAIKGVAVTGSGLSLAGFLISGGLAAGSTGVLSPVGAGMVILGTLLVAGSGIIEYFRDKRMANSRKVFNSFLAHFVRKNGPYHEVLKFKDSKGKEFPQAKSLKLAFEAVQKASHIKFWKVDPKQELYLYGLGFSVEQAAAIVGEKERVLRGIK
jgi:Subtilase family